MSFSSGVLPTSPSPGSPSVNLVLSANIKLQKNQPIVQSYTTEDSDSGVLSTNNNSKVGHSYCNRRGQREPGKLGQTLSAPKCHGWRHHSCVFLPENIYHTKRLMILVKKKKVQETILLCYGHV